MSDDLHKEMDELTKQIGPAQHKCNETYLAWHLAIREWEDLTRKRDAVWSKMLDSITKGITRSAENPIKQRRFVIDVEMDDLRRIL